MKHVFFCPSLQTLAIAWSSFAGFQSGSNITSLQKGKNNSYSGNSNVFGSKVLIIGNEQVQLKLLRFLKIKKNEEIIFLGDKKWETIDFVKMGFFSNKNLFLILQFFFSKSDDFLCSQSLV